MSPTQTKGVEAKNGKLPMSLKTLAYPAAAAVLALYAAPASANECHTTHVSCWSHMPVGGFCECKVHQTIEEGVVVRQKGAPAAESAVPYDASTETYLKIALEAASAGNKQRLVTALGRAETNLLTNAYVVGSVNGPINLPAVSIVRKARASAKAGDFSGAIKMIRKAMSEPVVKTSANGVGKQGDQTSETKSMTK